DTPPTSNHTLRHSTRRNTSNSLLHTTIVEPQSRSNRSCSHLSVIWQSLFIERYVSWLLVFFFSSRRRHTRCYRDWSSDVCSSDLGFGHDRSRHDVHLSVEPQRDGAAGEPRAALRGRLEGDARAADRDVEPGEPVRLPGGDGEAGGRRDRRPEADLSGCRAGEQQLDGNQVRRQGKTSRETVPTTPLDASPRR